MAASLLRKWCLGSFAGGESGAGNLDLDSVLLTNTDNGGGHARRLGGRIAGAGAEVGTRARVRGLRGRQPRVAGLEAQAAEVHTVLGGEVGALQPGEVFQRGFYYFRRRRSPREVRRLLRVVRVVGEQEVGQRLVVVLLIFVRKRTWT